MIYQLVKPHLKAPQFKEFKRGQIIYHEGDEPKSLYFIESGLIGLFHVAESGKETFLRVFGANDVLGHRSFFAKETYHASTIALSPLKLVTVSKEEFGVICKNHPTVLDLIAARMAKDLGNAELRMAGLLDKTAHKRISESLVYLKLKYPHYQWTRKEIAEYSGSTFETVTRVMSVLEKKDLLKKHGRGFTLNDPEKLLALEETELH